jgi:hypothetical protein
MRNKVICLLIMVLATGLNTPASYIGNPNALNGWDSSSATTVTDSTIYGDFINTSIYCLVDGSGIDPTSQLHSNLFDGEWGFGQQEKSKLWAVFCPCKFRGEGKL